MGSKRRKRLEMVVSAIQRRYGVKALRKLETPSHRERFPHIATGFPQLDDILGIGGVPRGRITEILGAPTSGTLTVAFKIAAAAQAAHGMAAYVDLDHTFDPDYAIRCGIIPSQFLLIRPRSGTEALEITYHFIASYQLDVLIFDPVSRLLTEPQGAQAFSSALRRLAGALADTRCALLFLTPLHFGDATSLHHYPDGFALPHYASVRLLLKKERWIKRRGDIWGYQTQVTVLKNRLAPPGKSAHIAITFDQTVLGNGT